MIVLFILFYVGSVIFVIYYIYKGIEDEIEYKRRIKGNYNYKRDINIDELELSLKENFEKNYLKEIKCENNTKYSKAVKCLEEVNFYNLINISIQYIKSLPSEEEEELFYNLNHGINIYNDKRILMQYLYSYGYMHKAKLDTTFDVFFQYILTQNIEVIDYGCGQALASLVFLEYIKKNRLDIFVYRIKLIEPSKIALSRGILHLNSFNNNIPVTPICKKLNDINENDLSTSNDTIKLHIFSNILDIEDINLEILSEKIQNTQRGENYFICVGPCNNLSNRICDFYDMFDEKFNIKNNSWEFFNNSKKWIEDKNWTINAKVFGINFDFKKVINIDDINYISHLP